MTKAQNGAQALEPLSNHQKKLLCWKSIIAGVFISLMAYILLTALGAGIGGLTASSLISNEEGGSGLLTGAGLWLGLSAVISLFLGSYFTLRVSRHVTNKVGAAHGFVVASIFFILLIWGAGHTLGTVSKGLGKMAGSLGSAASSVAQNPSVQDAVQKALGNSQLKSQPSEVVQGLALRLGQGDVDSAKSYFAYQTGLSQSEVDSKVGQLKTEFEEKAKVAGEKAANAVADAGWSLFVIFLVGLIGAVIGGRIGAQANGERPFARFQKLNENGSALPYVIGWFMGVPASVLFLIFLVRSC